MREPKHYFEMSLCEAFKVLPGRPSAGSKQLTPPIGLMTFGTAVKSVGEAEGKLEGIFLNSDQRSVARNF
jgi:hypothetical protein